MTTDTITKTTIPQRLDPRILSRIVEEGFGPGAWHGADLRAALANVTAKAAFWRPAPGRHNIAEVALHHAWCVRNAIAQLSGADPEPFPVDGSDWFELADGKGPSWGDIQQMVEEHHRRLAATIAGNGTTAPLPAGERFDLVLGITCHAIYHAGQIQLLKVLGAAQQR